MAGIDYLITDKVMVEVIAKIEGVRDAVREEAGEVFWRATANLAGHRDTGNSSVEIDTPGTYSHWGLNIYLVDPAGNALAIEFGHFVHNALFPRYVAGLYVLTKAAGLI